MTKRFLLQTALVMMVAAGTSAVMGGAGRGWAERLRLWALDQLDGAPVVTQMEPVPGSLDKGLRDVMPIDSERSSDVTDHALRRASFRQEADPTFEFVFTDDRDTREISTPNSSVSLTLSSTVAGKVAFSGSEGESITLRDPSNSSIVGLPLPLNAETKAVLLDLSEVKRGDRLVVKATFSQDSDNTISIPLTLAIAVTEPTLEFVFTDDRDTREISTPNSSVSLTLSSNGAGNVAFSGSGGKSITLRNASDNSIVGLPLGLNAESKVLLLDLSEVNRGDRLVVTATFTPSTGAPTTQTLTISVPRVEKPEISFKDPGDGSSYFKDSDSRRILVTRAQQNITLLVKVDEKGKLRISDRQRTQTLKDDVEIPDPNSPLEVTLPLSDFTSGRELTLVGTFTADDNRGGSTDVSSEPLTLIIDREGPRIRSATFDDLPVDDPRVRVVFETDDLDPSSVISDSFKLFEVIGTRREDKGTGRAELDPIQPGHVLIHTGPLTAGDYEISTTQQVSGGSLTPRTDQNIIKDKAGNLAGTYEGKSIAEVQTFPFSVYPRASTGPQVEYPQFLAPKVEGDREEPFNPDDFVITRVVRLYYMRNAHRVAQIVNRTVRSYNEAAVTQAQRAAERAREQADQRTADRQAAERAAIRQAEALRRAEDNLAAAQQTLAETQELAAELANVQSDLDAENANLERVNTQIRTITDQIDTLEEQNVDENANQLENLRNQLIDLQSQRDIFERRIAQYKQEEADILRVRGLDARSRAELENQVNELRGDVVSARNSMLDAQEDAAVAQSQEDRAKEEQFRKEVAAATEDPDTYAPGKLDSVDPVAQVSVSVIGEGLIQLRGPTKGVNKIRTMINQMDSPLGQVKVGIYTVQINGERGDRMDRVARRIEGHIDLSRYLTSHSLMLLRRSVQEVASEIAIESCGPMELDLHGRQVLDGHTQIDRDRRYLYAFFGRDFVDSLFAMNSEFLYTGNRLLSLNSMDNISLNRALLVLALARNDVRRRIIARFLDYVQGELPDAEYKYRLQTRLNKDSKHVLEKVYEDAALRYRFANFLSFFDNNIEGSDTLNPIQLEFLRLAQIFKSQMVAEVELKQRTVERGLIQDRANDELAQAEILSSIQSKLREKIQRQLSEFVDGESAFQQGLSEAEMIVTSISRTIDQSRQYSQRLSNLGDGYAYTAAKNKSKIRVSAENVEDILSDLPKNFNSSDPTEINNARIRQESIQKTFKQTFNESLKSMVPEGSEAIAATKELGYNTIAVVDSLTKHNIDKIFIFRGSKFYRLRDNWNEIVERRNRIDSELEKPINEIDIFQIHDDSTRITGSLPKILEEFQQGIRAITTELVRFRSTLSETSSLLAPRIGTALKPGRELPTLRLSSTELTEEFAQLVDLIERTIDNAGPEDTRKTLIDSVERSFLAVHQGLEAVESLQRSTQLKDATRQQLDHRKLLDHLIDEKEEKYIELVDGTRAYTANVDAYLKRMVVALEDDCRIQFYDPAFEQVRRSAREYDVELGQVERTTVLTNNRQLAKVEPTATMEFDLPKRDILITEAMKGAKALVQDYGALLQDPTFLAATDLLSGSPPTSSYSMPLPEMPGLINEGYQTPLVKSVLPNLPSSTQQQLFNTFGKTQNEIGANLEALIPDPAIYKFETGTGFEIRPVIQPDGDSVIYDFNYLYTTNVREPVRPDEKHLGRVKQHFINTQVQTSTYELREISRYTVALKAARTSRGVPLLEDVPGLGILFRPLPSAESSLQQNIILGQSTVYPTLFDLMGLRWAPYVVDLEDLSLQEEEFVVRGRRKVVEHWTFEESSSRVDDFLRMREHPNLYREDLYRRQDQPTPFHPLGYDAPHEDDPRAPQRPFLPSDPRPSGYQQPELNPLTGRLDRRPLPRSERFDLGGDSVPPLESFPAPSPTDGPIEIAPPYLPSDGIGMPIDVPPVREDYVPATPSTLPAPLPETGGFNGDSGVIPSSYLPPLPPGARPVRDRSSFEPSGSADRSRIPPPRTIQAEQPSSPSLMQRLRRVAGRP
ncbi:hypothetical protein [Tautonia marina]|uniref:hypothetical protein n=1 Tax=Tautonia marina TaxID=2653855 RepID=UPI001375DFC9|nr:hypothetical protein [Tautonia marina]